MSENKWLLLRMRKSGRNFVCRRPENIEIELGDICVVEVDRSEDYVKVIKEIVPSDDDKKNSIVKKIKRKLTDKDKERIESNKKKEEYARQKCLRRIKDHKLDMKLVAVEYSLDSSKIIFYFTAEGRVDFRVLVKSLASEFRARIELRQIGVRDEAKIIGGVGCCGRLLCCNNFLNEFAPINIKMAKEQRLPLNPTKISGLCGRLLCCLKYEHDFYRKAIKGMPSEGSIVSTVSGNGRVVDLNVVKGTVLVELDNRNVSEFLVKEIKIVKEQRSPKPKKAFNKSADSEELRKLEDDPGSSS